MLNTFTSALCQKPFYNAVSTMSVTLNFPVHHSDNELEETFPYLCLPMYVPYFNIISPMSLLFHISLTDWITHILYP